MICRNCLNFTNAAVPSPLSRYTGEAKPEPSPHGYCQAGDTPIERALLINASAACRYQPSRFRERRKS